VKAVPVIVWLIVPSVGPTGPPPGVTVKSAAVIM
jgi:hypothetical protein